MEVFQRQQHHQVLWHSASTLAAIQPLCSSKHGHDTTRRIAEGERRGSEDQVAGEIKGKSSESQVPNRRSSENSQAEAPFWERVLPSWTEEVFVVDQVLPTRPVTYKIRDLADEPIVGSFYEQQMQKTTQTTFRIEKVLRKRKGQALVKWKGYPEKFNSWVPLEDMERLWPHHQTYQPSPPFCTHTQNSLIGWLIGNGKLLCTNSR